MKKRYLIIIIVAIVILAIGGFFVYKTIEKNGKKYEIAKVNEYNYFVIKHDDKYGVMDKSGKLIIDSIYEDVKIPNPEKPVFLCEQSGNTKVLNDKNEQILTDYDVEAIRLKNIATDLMYEKSVLKYSKDGKYGLISFEGKELTKPIYDEIDSLPYKEGELLITKEQKLGVINIKGNKIIDAIYDEIAVDGYNSENKENEGYIVSVKTEDGYRYGYVDNKGKEVLEPQYNELSRVKEIQEDKNVYLIGAKDGQFGVIKNDETIIANEFQSIRYDSSVETFVVEKSKKVGAMNITGKEIIPIQYDQIDTVGVYLYAQNTQGTTVYNNDGTQANVDSNISIINTSNQNYKIRINNKEGTKYGVIDKNGKQIIEEKYNYITYLYDNYFIVSDENSKFGVLDDKGNVKIEIKYDSLNNITDTDLIETTITEEKTTQIYSKEMQLVCEMENAQVENKQTYIKMFNDKETKYISNDGKMLENTEVFANNKLFAKMQENKWGFVDKQGKVIVDYQYDKITEFNKYGFAGVNKDGKWGVINEEGKEIVEPIYELGEQTQPDFIGKYYKVVYGVGEFYYTDNNV